MDQAQFHEYLAELDFDQSTNAIWYSPGIPANEQVWQGGDFPSSPFSSHGFLEKTSPKLDIIIVKGHPRFTSVSATRADFELLLELFKIPHAYLHAIFSNNGQLAHFLEHSTGENCSRISVVMQTPHSPTRSFSLALGVSLQTGSAAGIVLVETKSDSERVVRSLRNSQDKLKECPLHVLTILCQEMDRRNEEWRENLDASLVRSERRIGTTAYYSVTNENKSFSAKVPYESIVRDLHTINTSLIWLNHTTNFELATLKFTKSMYELYEQEMEALSLPSLSKAAKEKLLQPVRYLKNATEMRQYQRGGLQQRVETQIQILYSRISQRDNRLNLQIAMDSGKIAEFTREDSIAINTISVVTLFFLPAMLVATVCSSGAFEFKEDAIVVSHKWWILLVFTAGLTAVILGLWSIYLRWKRRSDPGKFSISGGYEIHGDDYEVSKN